MKIKILLSIRLCSFSFFIKRINFGPQPSLYISLVIGFIVCNYFFHLYIKSVSNFMFLKKDLQYEFRDLERLLFNWVLLVNQIGE